MQLQQQEQLTKDECPLVDFKKILTSDHDIFLFLRSGFQMLQLNKTPKSKKSQQSRSAPGQSVARQSKWSRSAPGQFWKLGSGHLG